MNKLSRTVAGMLGLVLVTVLLSGCPFLPEEENGDYDLGYEEGFASDPKYWEGYEDSYYTDPPDGPILYSGSEIPYIEEETYDAGYYDGLWYAYNDGYFVSYDFGFTIGFSEGYDIAYNDFWYDFLMSDAHPEYLDGSFMDGYMDGFSEGSVFGAYDYTEGLTFDWEDAMWDYRSGTDLYIEEVGFGTGEYGVVELYEYGVDPNDYYAKALSATRRTPAGKIRVPRKSDEGKSLVSRRTPAAKSLEVLKQDKAVDDEILYRPLTSAVRTELNQLPAYSPRSSEYALLLEDTWLERIERYLAERQ